MSESSARPVVGSYLLPHFDHATVADAMHPGVLSCDPDATLTEVARMMSTHHVHCIVIKGNAGGPTDEPSVWGIVSDFDLLRAGVHPRATDTAADVAMQPVIRVQTTTPLRDAASLMLAKGASHVVAVTPESESPVGVLSTLDIAGVLGWGEL